MNSKKIKGTKDAIKYIENNLINKIFEFFKTGKYEANPLEYMEFYSTVQIVCDEDPLDSNYPSSKEFYEYYKQTIENYIIDCKKKLINEGKDNIIDTFLLHTNNIKFLIYQLQRVFCYLDRFYISYTKTRKSLSEIAFDLYKLLFYEEFKDKIQEEINNLKKDEKNGNEELNTKIQSIMKIEEDMKLVKPYIDKDKGNKEIIWRNEGRY